MILDEDEVYSDEPVRELLEQLRNEPRGFLEGMDSAASIYPHVSKGCGSIVFLGVGGSGIVGDMVSDMLSDSCKVPLLCVKGYDFPRYLMDNSFVIAVSYSGNTAETLSSMLKAYDAGLPIVAITSGGLMGELCTKFGIAHAVIRKNLLPRMAVPNMVSAAITVLANSGIVDFDLEEFKNTVKNTERVLDSIDTDVPSDKNVAKSIAYGIHDKIAFIYSGHGISSLGYRLKCQLNENAKMLCVHNTLPEALHNDIEGWQPEYSGRAAAIFIRSKFEHPAVSEAFVHMKDMIRNQISLNPYEILCDGKSKVEENLSGILVCDYVSLYAAVLRKVNPVEVDRIKSVREGINTNKEILESLRGRVMAY